ncbi:hypothetical protein OG413_41480 [Streptomyces sp. NBC_01433]|uniref:hypothetical protein n=1 Tax=Streptomyces sp. NBC_01433 TaxID=2903864 RepID=UPI00224FD10A|nr:hypothetical protein [Streptomyces sp. NBC_01433]MCX4681676.1 hypothetical protein [Streptomyces sp. NBC_01433]
MPATPTYHHKQSLLSTLVASGLWTGLKSALADCETRPHDSPYSEGFDFTSCQHPRNICSICLSGSVRIGARTGNLSVTVRRVHDDQWMAALGAIGPASEPAKRNPYSLGPLGVPGWQKVKSFVPNTTCGQLILPSPIDVSTHFKNHSDPAFLLATVGIAPSTREHCVPAWDQGVRFLQALTSGGADADTAVPCTA